MRVLLAITAVLCVLPSVLGHAALVTPSAFNPNPIKTFTCGGPTAGTVNVVAAGANTLQWKLIASDGAGDVSMFVDPAGVTTNFPTSYTGTKAATVQSVGVIGTTTSTQVGTTFTFDYTMPDVTCTGSMGGRTDVCTAQVVSASNWVACFAFAKTAPTGNQNPTYVCSLATGLTACPMVNGKHVNIPTGYTLASLDLEVSTTLNQNLPNTNVFLTGNTPAAPGAQQTPCEQSYRAYLCGATFGACAVGTNAPPPVSPCQAVCSQFECWCGMNALHADLYQCELYNNAGSDLAGQCDKGYGPQNQTCITPSSSSGVGGSCADGVLADCSAASSTAPTLLIALAAAVAARYALRF